MVCKVKKEGMKTYFDIDGKRVMPSAYMSYNPKKEYIDSFKRNGVNIFMFPIYAGDEGINMESGLRPFCKNFFKGYGEYDFSDVERVLEMIGNDEGIYIIPRVCLEPPKWWQDMHPEELSRDHRGEPQRQCFTSELWREDMTKALFALIDYFNASKWKNNLIGIHIAAGGTEEWTYHGRYKQQFYDYSECNLKAYKNWLREKYKDAKSLSSAWGCDIPDFEQVTFPTAIERAYAKRGILRDPHGERAVLDYYDFHNLAVADTINYFCRQVKEYTGGEKVTGVFYGYVFSMSQSYKGLHALAQVFESPYVDFVSTTNIGMEPGEAWVFSSAVSSANINGKLWMAEGDIRTCLTRGLDVSIPHATPDNDHYSSSVWVGPATHELSCSAITKALSRIVTSNCGIWWFDMFGGWLEDQGFLDLISKTPELLASQNHKHVRSEVAVIIDEGGYKYFGMDNDKMLNAIREVGQSLAHAGIAYDIYLQSDIKKDSFPADDYKLFIFLVGVKPENADKRAIEERLKQGNKTLLWLHSSSFYDSELCGFELERRESRIDRTALYKGKSYPKYPLPVHKFKSDEGYVLSTLDDGEEAAVIWRRFSDYSSVYSLTLSLHSDLIREIAVLSGVHIYSYSDDCIFAGGEFVAIHACSSGYKRINLPKKHLSAKNAITGEEIKVNDMFIDIKMEKHETIIIHLFSA